jgi:pimeloyl-ACP methyl ester carboxylesterase
MRLDDQRRVRNHYIAVFIAIAGCNAHDEPANAKLIQTMQDLPSGGGDTADPCDDWNVIRIDVPIYPDRPGSPTFSYAYQIQFATGDWQTAPVGIVVNGGPGAPSIGMDRGRVFPPWFNVIYTDVRGVGCNINADNPFLLDALTTEYYARDVLAIVRKYALDDYILFGVSYGTVHGTVITNIAEREEEGVHPPKALVLEGILGTWEINRQDIVDYDLEWNKLKPRLPPSVVEALSRTPLPLGYSSSNWANFLAVTLNEGTTPAIGNSTIFHLTPLATGDPAGIARIHEKMAQIQTPGPKETIRIGIIGVCTETQGEHFAKDLVNGQLVFSGPEICRPWGLEFTHPYDSINYPVTVPIYYFEGENDPNTSPANAAHHFTHQTQADRVFTIVWGGGHQDLTSTLHQTGCTPAIFDAIEAGGVGFKAALESCHWGMSVTRREPE